MIKKLLTICILLSAFLAYSQETTIPDANFESFLEANGMGNGVLDDNLITTANIENVTILDLTTSADIESLTGIEDFTALKTLNCSSSNITTINLSTLSNLESLNCGKTDLVVLDVTANTSLQELYVNQTALTELDLSQNTALTILQADTNPNLASLNVKNGNNINVTYIDAVDSPNLFCIVVDDPTYSEENWNYFSDMLFSDVDCALTAIPNNSFLDNLQVIPALEGSFTGTSVLTHKVAALTTLNISGSSINNLTGIEDFVGLQELTCINTSITNIDLTQNIALTTLNIANNLLVDLDVSKNVLLTTLYCNDNNLINLSLNKNTLLEKLDCSSNELIRLNLKNENNGAMSISNLDANSSLACIQVDDPTATYLTGPIWIKDAQSNYSLNCGDTYVPDVVFENYLETHDSGGNTVPLGDATSLGNGILDDQYITTSNINTITSFTIRDQPIADLTGLEDFINLEDLELNNLDISSLDVSQNLALEFIQVIENVNLTTVDITKNVALTEVQVYSSPNLKTMDFTQNIALIDIRCNGNNFSSIDVTQNVALEELRVHENSLTSIDVTKNNLLRELQVSENRLSSIDVSQNVLLERIWCTNSNLTSIDFSQNGALTSFFGNDGVFETLDFSTNTLLKSTNFGNNNLTSLNLKNGNNDIITSFDAIGNSNLTCIQVDDAAEFTTEWESSVDETVSFGNHCYETYVPDDNFEQALIDLGYDSGPLDDYVLTSNISSVTTINLGSKGISNFTGLEDFIALETLLAFTNTMSSLNVTANVNLKLLLASDNALLTTLNVSALTALEDLNISGTDISTIDVSNNLALKIFWTSPSITHLDLTANTALTEFYALNGALESLNIKNGNNGNVTNFSTTGNPNLACINVDDETASYLSSWTTDASASFNEHCYETYVEDTVFENYLETHTNTGGDVPLGDITSLGNGILNDHYVTTSNINAVTNFIIRNQAVADLTGLEDFVNLEELELNNLDISSLDVSQNSLLDYMQVTDNINLTTVNITQNTALTDVQIYGNGKLTGIDFTQNVALINITCHENNLLTLDITKNVLLEGLKVAKNGLRNVDVTKNILLKTISVSENQLSGIDVSKNVLLERIWCVNSNLTSVDFSKNTVLNSFYGNDGIFETLDFSQNPLLRRVNCENNNLTSLNLKNGNNALLTDEDALSATGNPNLTCIMVDDADYARTTLIDIDDTISNFSEHCYETYVPDDIFETYLETHNASGVSVTVGDETSMGNGISDDNYVTTSAIENVVSLELPYLIPAPGQVIDPATLISNLTGLEGFIALVNFDIRFHNIANLDVTENINLETLTCYNSTVANIDVSTNLQLESLILSGNEIMTLDITNNTQLIELNIASNNIEDIDLSNNTLLEEARLNFNQFSTIDFSLNPLLKKTFLNGNQLTSVNLKNGNNGIINTFIATGNSNLTCILVDNAVDFTADWEAFIDAQTSFNDVSCVTFVPDDNFENYLETHDADGVEVAIGDASSMGNGVANDDYVTTEKIENVSRLSVSGKSIAKLIGIEDFTALEELYCGSNSLEELDVTQNTQLTKLNCQENQIEDLDVTQNTALIELSCHSNALYNLDVSKNIALTYFDCKNNQIISLDLTQNIVLNEFYCYENALTSLNLKNGNNLNLPDMDAYGNPNLSCILVDDVSASVLNSWGKDDTASFNDISCGVLLSPKVFLQGAFLNPNTGEETLMRDDLRVAGYIDSQSPYNLDATSAEVLAVTGENAIVDWIYIELRNANDNTLIETNASALLQRDGDIVGIDGVSPLNMGIPWGNYYVSIRHRNHLSIVTAATVSLSDTTTTVNFTTDSTVTLGGTNAVVEMGNGVFAMLGGDYDENGQIQNSDTSSVILELGASGYSKADMDMNGQIQNSDINNILNPNIGKGKQF